MRVLFAVIVTILFSVSSAVAQHVEWVGSFCITAATQTCNATGWKVGDCLASRYAEPNVGDSGTETNLSVFNRTYAVNFKSPSASIIGTAFQPVTASRVGYSFDQFPSAIRITTEKPSPVVAGTPFIRSYGDINTWDGTVGCNISFLATHTLCPQTYC